MVKLASAEMAEKKLATRAAFGATLAELAEEGVPVVAVDADLTGSTTTKKFAAAAPENASMTSMDTPSSASMSAAASASRISTPQATTVASEPSRST